jgi:hypothetical protein
MVEHLTFNQVVLGSSPSGLTNVILVPSNFNGFIARCVTPDLKVCSNCVHDPPPRRFIAARAMRS